MMRFRTKLFIIWGATILLPLAAITLPLQRMLQSSFDRVAVEGFAGTGQSLSSLQAERVSRMKQAGELVMCIPELRALIAEHNYEIAPENIASLQERLDSLRAQVDVSFICVIDGHGSLIAQNHGSPWSNLTDLQRYMTESPQAQAMVRRLFTTSPPGTAHEKLNGEHGLWVYDGRLFQVVGVPLTFSSSDADQAALIDGALVMAIPITDDIAKVLGKSHDCDITFLAGGKPVASSLAPAKRAQLTVSYQAGSWPISAPFNVPLGNQTYRSLQEPLADAASGMSIGTMLIQSSTAQADEVQRKLRQSFVVMVLLGLAAALIVSFLLSFAITRPVQDLVQGAQRVAGGDLNVSLVVRRRDELGHLAIAFNDMVHGLQKQRELKALVEESQAASKAKSQFLANMSHEIRTPLHGVIGMSEVLLRTELTDRQRRYMGLVKSSAEVLTTLINDILDFSKIEAGKLELECVEFELAPLIEDVVELLAQKAFAKGLEITSFIATDLPARVNGDPTRIRQILLNLLSNAIKFTDVGGVHVEAAADSSGGDGPRIKLSVSDSGIGIPPDRVDRLFKSFSQIDASTTRRYGGTGLGLAICKQLVELMGGKIGVESIPGSGSTFWLTIDLRALAGQGAPESQRSTPELNQVRVLIVNQHQTCQHAFSTYLADVGMDVDCASTGDEAISRLSAAYHHGKPFALALLDTRVNGVSAHDLAARIRSHPAGETTRLVLLSAEQDLSEDRRLHEQGFCRTVAKPVRRTQLLEAIKGALSADASIERQTGVEMTAITTSPMPTATGPALTMSSITAEPTVALGSRQKFRILVAEDQEVNQLVVSELLEGAGYTHEIVSSGGEAVELFKTIQYDLVLMDCQMPDMDGFEAASAIRKYEKTVTSSVGSSRAVPIIALTANIGDGDRDRCLAAGMNSYCGKPYSSKQLLDAIAAHLPSSAPVMEISTSPEISNPPSSELPPFDTRAVLDRCSGKASLATKVLEKFEMQAAAAMAEIEQAIADHDADRLARVSHGIKGTAGIVSAESLRLIAAKLEHAGRDHTLDYAAECFDQLRTEVDRCSKYVAQVKCELAHA